MVGAGWPSVGAVVSGVLLPVAKSVATVEPSGRLISPVSTNSSNPVCWMMPRTWSVFSRPGNSPTIRSLPATWSTFSLTPRALVRFSMIRRAVSIESASSLSVIASCGHVRFQQHLQAARRSRPNRVATFLFKIGVLLKGLVMIRLSFRSIHSASATMTRMITRRV